VVQQKINVSNSLALVRRRENLSLQRAELGVSPGYDSSTIIAQQQLDGGVIDSFSQIVEKELQSWEFPDAKRVFFELPKMDISVAGKSRIANGKGVRSLLHGAFTVALMKFCQPKALPHPGFVILDSLFITYRDPDDQQDSEIANTPLRDRAFSSFESIPDDLQLIIIENVDVPDWLAAKPQCTHFTGDPTTQRTGLFPPVSNKGPS
jgi:hypothetical protein